MDEQLQQLRLMVPAADAAAICSSDGMILAVESAAGIDDSVLGDIVAAAATMANETKSLLQEAPHTILCVGEKSAAVTRQLADSRWVAVLLSEPTSLGLTLEALAGVTG